MRVIHIRVVAKALSLEAPYQKPSASEASTRILKQSAIDSGGLDVDLGHGLSGSCFAFVSAFRYEVQVPRAIVVVLHIRAVLDVHAMLSGPEHPRRRLHHGLSIVARVAIRVTSRRDIRGHCEDDGNETERQRAETRLSPRPRSHLPSHVDLQCSQRRRERPRLTNRARKPDPLSQKKTKKKTVRRSLAAFVRSACVRHRSGAKTPVVPRPLFRHAVSSSSLRTR